MGDIACQSSSQQYLPGLGSKKGFQDPRICLLFKEKIHYAGKLGRASHMFTSLAGLLMIHFVSHSYVYYLRDNDRDICIFMTFQSAIFFVFGRNLLGFVFCFFL